MREGVFAVRVTAAEQRIWTAGAAMLRTSKADFVRLAVAEKLERLADSRATNREGM